MNEFLQTQILTELEDAVGRENCSIKEIDKATHSVDYFWLSRMWADRGRRMPEADSFGYARQQDCRKAPPPNPAPARPRL